MNLDENEPTRLVFHGRKEKNLRKGFRLRGYPSGKLGKERKKNCQRGSHFKWTSEGKRKKCQGRSGFTKIFEALTEERKAMAGRALGVESRVGPLIKKHGGNSSFFLFMIFCYFC